MNLYDWLYEQSRGYTKRSPVRAEKLLEQLGYSTLPFKAIHVLGTNGKGSVCAMLEAGCVAAGVGVGKFTSPHLQRFEERICINGQELNPQRTEAFILWAQEHAADMPFFALSLGLAVESFAQDRLDYGIIEAGVGGLNDTTNAITPVALTLITNVDLDHVGVLGHTIEAIARDKAGAIRSGTPVLTTATGVALEVIREVAEEKVAPLYTPEQYPELFALPYPPALAGEYQKTNAALALATLRLLGLEAGIAGALQAKHAGRLEQFEVAGRTVWLDGAHNPHAAAALTQSLGSVDTLLMGMFKRKDASSSLASLTTLSQQRIYTYPEPQAEGAFSPQELAMYAAGDCIDDPVEAFQQAVGQTPVGGQLLVCGSLYLVGYLRNYIAQK